MNDWKYSYSGHMMRSMAMDMTLDQAILDAFALSASQRPAIVRPYYNPDGNIDTLLADLQRQQNEAEACAPDWHEGAERRCQEISNIFSLHTVLPHHIATLDRTIELLEQRAEEEAGELGREQKRATRLIKQIKQYSPVKSRAIGDVLEAGQNLTKAYIDSVLEFALLLRALRSEHDPDNHVVATASSGSEVKQILERFLN